MSFIIQYTYDSVKNNYWNIIFLYQYEIEAWLSENKCVEVFNIVYDENENILIVHNSKGINISIELRKSESDETLRIAVNSNISDKLMLEQFQTLIKNLEDKIVTDHEKSEMELKKEHQELCNIEYVIDHI